MEALDFRKQAERLVEKFYISDLEWREMLIDTYEQVLRHEQIITETIPDNVIWLDRHDLNVRPPG